MKNKGFKEKNTEDLSKTLTEKREEIRNEKFGSSGSKSRNVRGIRAIKRDIARILTEISTRKISDGQTVKSK